MRQNLPEFNDLSPSSDAGWEIIADALDHASLPPLSADFTDRVLAAVGADTKDDWESVTPAVAKGAADPASPPPRRFDIAVWAAAAAAALLLAVAAGGWMWWPGSNDQLQKVVNSAPVPTSESAVGASVGRLAGLSDDAPADEPAMQDDAVATGPLVADANADLVRDGVAEDAPKARRDMIFIDPFRRRMMELQYPDILADLQEIRSYAQIQPVDQVSGGLKPVADSFGVAFDVLLKTIPRTRSSNDSQPPQAWMADPPRSATI